MNRAKIHPPGHFFTFTPYDCDAAASRYSIDFHLFILIRDIGLYLGHELVEKVFLRIPIFRLPLSRE